MSEKTGVSHSTIYERRVKFPVKHSQSAELVGGGKDHSPICSLKVGSGVGGTTSVEHRKKVGFRPISVNQQDLSSSESHPRLTELPFHFLFFLIEFPAQGTQIQLFEWGHQSKKGLTGVSSFSGLAAFAPLRFSLVLEAVIGTSFATPVLLNMLPESQSYQEREYQSRHYKDRWDERRIQDCCKIATIELGNPAAIKSEGESVPDWLSRSKAAAFTRSQSSF